MVEFDALMARPYPVAIPLMLLGLVLLGFALRGGTPDHAMLALDVLGMAFGLWLAATWWNPSQIAGSLSSKVWWQRFARAVEAARRRLHPEARWAVGDEGSHVDFPFWTNKLLGRVDTGFPLGLSSRSKAPP